MKTMRCGETINGLGTGYIVLPKMNCSKHPETGSFEVVGVHCSDVAFSDIGPIVPIMRIHDDSAYPKFALLENDLTIWCGEEGMEAQEALLDMRRGCIDIFAEYVDNPDPDEMIDALFEYLDTIPEPLRHPMLDSIMISVMSNNSPGYLPDSDPSIFIDAEAKDIAEAMSGDLSHHYEYDDSIPEDHYMEMIDSARRTCLESTDGNIYFKAVDGRVYTVATYSALNWMKESGIQILDGAMSKNDFKPQ